MTDYELPLLETAIREYSGGDPHNVVASISSVSRGDMIYTVTLNPALDRTVWVDKIQFDDANRIEREERYAGGKGIDVSKVLTTLGAENKALGLIGGFAGEELEGRLVNEGVSCDFTRIADETRTNIIVNEISSGKQVAFSDRGPNVGPYELMQIVHKLERLDKPDMVVISGSLPFGIHPEVYRRLIALAKGKGARVILDTDGEALRVGIQGLPDIIKPNVHELSRLVDEELQEVNEITRVTQRVREKGIGIVLVSMGARGILLAGEKERYLASPPDVTVKNTIGAGDSAVAGFAYGLATNKTVKEALIYAVAAGTATTLRPGTALCQKEDFLKLVPEIRLQTL
jgi:6-phosphofructokinase 2